MKKTQKIKLIVFFLCFVLVSGFIAQIDPFEQILSELEEYNKNNQQEKVHLHLDKSYYAIGEDIWFKAYVLNTVTAQPSQISNTLYVELINYKDSVTKKLRIPLSFGMGWGDFNLKDSLDEGNYRIRAYTQWMRNAGPEYFYDKTIKIGNTSLTKVLTNTRYIYTNDNKINSTIKFTQKNGTPYKSREVKYEIFLDNEKSINNKGFTNEQGEINIEFVRKDPSTSHSGRIVTYLSISDKENFSKVIPIKLTSSEVDIQFFPEGGNLIENIPCKIAVKAVGSDGRGKKIELSIKDQAATEVANVVTEHYGMASFNFNPLNGHTYTGTVTFADGSKKDISLPRALPQGYALSINNSDSSSVSIKVIISEGLLGKGDIKLIAQHNNKVIYATKAKSDKQIISLNLPKEKMASGIIKITLFGPDNSPNCERIFFNNSHLDKLNLEMENLASVSKRIARTTTRFKVSHTGKYTPGSFSVAVNNISKAEPDELNESNIFTDLLLTSDLTGYVENPNYYFLRNDRQTRDRLDLLMQTQGWRRFIWKDFLKNKNTPIVFQPEKLIVISGTVTSYNGKPVENGKVSLFSSSGNIFSIDTLTDNNGRFAFKEMFFGDSVKFAVQARNNKDNKKVDIKMDEPSMEAIGKNKNAGNIDVNVNESLAQYLKNSDNYFEELRRGMINNSISLETVNIVAKKTQVTESDNINGPGMADNILLGSDLEKCISIVHCLIGKLPGVTVRGNVPGTTRRSFFTPLTVYLDGIKVDWGYMENITIDDIKSIEFLRSIGLTFVYKADGAVAVITLKKPKERNSHVVTPGLLAHNPLGYHTAREFYSPKYEPNINSSPNDYRSTIYWKPNIITDKDGNASFEYHNANEPGTYRVVIEGIDAFGNLGRKVYTYEVK